jgi:tripartite-type tricarboxylate transporter receptor subunit TctC
VISSLQKYISNVINQPAVNKKLTDFGIEPIGNTPQQYQSLLRTETTKWQKLIKDLNISLD